MERPKHADIALGIGVVGFLSAVAMVLIADPRELQSTWLGEFGVVIIAGPSAWLAGLACGAFFGNPGAGGWALASLGAIFSTLLGAAIAGTIVIPVFGTIIAPLALADEAIERPALLILWAILMAGFHVLVLKSNIWGASRE